MINKGQKRYNKRYLNMLHARHSWADSLDREEIIRLGDLILHKSIDIINIALQLNNFKKMKTIEITKSYEVKTNKDLRKGDKFFIKKDGEIKEITVVNMDNSGSIVGRGINQRTPIYIKKGTYIREIGTEKIRFLEEDEIKEYGL